MNHLTFGRVGRTWHRRIAGPRGASGDIKGPARMTLFMSRAVRPAAEFKGDGRSLSCWWRKRLIATQEGGGGGITADSRTVGT